jgi:polysaccharide deacetylase family protein (PEP-CTERM system associated)
VHAFEKVIDRRSWDRHESRVVPNTRRILALLRDSQVKATFFVLGWVAERHPELVREIVAEGHELASHGYDHQLIYQQTPRAFADDIRNALDQIERAFADTDLACSARPVGYRAPSFSITDRSLWALDVLRDAGFQYDSSIFPLAAHDRYGMSHADRFANRLDNGLWEFPVSTVRLVSMNLPVAGGGYFRLLPLWLTRKAIERINGDGHPVVIYLHPWEFDPDQPRIRQASTLSRFRHYVNLDTTELKLRALLRTHRFAPMRVAFARQLEVAA